MSVTSISLDLVAVFDRVVVFLASSVSLCSADRV